MKFLLSAHYPILTQAMINLLFFSNSTFLPSFAVSMSLFPHNSHILNCSDTTLFDGVFNDLIGQTDSTLCHKIHP